MESSPHSSAAPPGAPLSDAQISTRVYQCMTIAAMLLLLGSLWLF